MLTAALKFPHKIRIQHLSKKNTETPNWIQATIPKPPNPRPGKMKKKKREEFQGSKIRRLQSKLQPSLLMFRGDKL
jgi:hypothetical protein